jgi:hypothetical protein
LTEVDGEGEGEVERPRRHRDGAKFVEPGHAGQRAGEHQACFEGLPVVQFDEHAGGRLVGYLEAQLAQRRHLRRSPLAEIHAAAHGVERDSIAVLAHQFFPGFAGDRVEDAIPVAATGHSAQGKRTGRAGQQGAGGRDENLTP